MEPVLEQSNDIKALERAMLAMSNTLHVIDAAAFLALYNISLKQPLSVPKDFDASAIAPRIQKMLDVIQASNQASQKKETDGTSKD